MSQQSLKEKFDDEKFLITAIAVELEDVKKTLVQLKLQKPKPIHSGPFSLNVDYYIKKNQRIGQYWKPTTKIWNKRTTPRLAHLQEYLDTRKFLSRF